MISATADVLPQEVPEAQVVTSSSIIEAVGIVTEKTSTVWQIGDAGLIPLASPRYDGNAIRSGSIAYVTYHDQITTNGGQISEVKSFSLDTRGKTEGLYNIETEKVLTYTSQNGSHLMDEESYVLDVAGNWSTHGSDLVCVFSSGKSAIIPAFCNKVTASSKLTSVTTAQVETVGGLTAVAEKASVPAALNYEISVTPGANSVSGYADGIVSTTFTASVMEGQSDGAVTQGSTTTPGTLGTWDWDPTPGYSDQVTDCSAWPPGAGRCASNPATPSNWDWDPTPGYSDQVTDCSAWNGPAGHCTVNQAGIPGTTELADFWNLPSYDQLASTLTYIDTATVAGGISTFNKAFTYQSGVSCTDC